MALPTSKEQWLRFATESKMPVFGVTAGKLASLAEDDTSNASALARIILSDPAMTARVLHIANSAYYNPTTQTIKTISRAIVLLGFEKIHSICISVSIIDGLLKGQAKNRLLKKVAESFHAAVQAKSMVNLLGEGPEEEVFIAGLLYHIGEMVFWCYGGEQANELEKQINQSLEGQDHIQQTVLGFQLKDLTVELAKEWNLGHALTQALGESPNPPPWATCVRKSAAFTANLEHGWDSEPVQKIIRELSEIVGMKPHQLKQVMQANANEAMRQAKLYKLPQAELFIPTANEEPEEPDLALESGAIIDVEFDDSLQIEILRELSSSVKTKPDANIILQLVLEGLHRGVGLDRVMVAILTPDRKHLNSKFILSNYDEPLTEHFKIALSDKSWQLFAKIMVNKQCVWVGMPDDKIHQKLVTTETVKLLETKRFFSAPLAIGDKIIGCLYGDRQPSGRGLEENMFKAFQHFSHEANMAMALLKK